MLKNKLNAHYNSNGPDIEWIHSVWCATLGIEYYMSSTITFCDYLIFIASMTGQKSVDA